MTTQSTPPITHPVASDRARAVTTAPPVSTRVVVGVDEDAASWAALRFAAVEAARRGGDVLAVHCWQTPGSWTLPSTFDRRPPTAGVLGLGAVVDTLLAERTAAGEPDVVITAQTVQGEAATELWLLARDAALLVVGARHHDVLLGSVSHFLSGHPPCPLVVVPAHPR